MKLSTTVIYFGSYSRGTPGGAYITVLDEGPCYSILRDGESIGAIDSEDDLDAFGAANHYPG